MFTETVQYVRCAQPDCDGGLSIDKVEKNLKSPWGEEIAEGLLRCTECGFRYPMYWGVALLVQKPEVYVNPKTYDVDATAVGLPKMWESDEVLHSYLLNQILLSKLDLAELLDFVEPQFMKNFVSENFEQSLLSVCTKRLTHLIQDNSRVLEIGCNVGTCLYMLGKAKRTQSLGIDLSLRSILAAREVFFGFKSPFSVLGPEAAPFAQDISQSTIDFVVGDAESMPAKEQYWDVAIALNVLDLLAEPLRFPKRHLTMCRPGGTVVLATPFNVNSNLCHRLDALRGERTYIETLSTFYSSLGSSKLFSRENIPWLFLRSQSYMELYSSHMLIAKRNTD